MGAGDDAVDCALEDFERHELLGSGGNADVHRATVTVGNRTHEVALKTPRMANYETVDTVFFEEFAREAEIWARIDDHESIVDVFDWGQDPYPWIALEYVEDGNLADWMDDLSTAQRVRFFEEICDAVFHAHRHGVSHGDLKPENVLVTRENGELIAKVGDWGLANVLLDHSQSAEGLTIAYSAPEQVDPETYGNPDDRTDIYQLGVIAYELFTGRTPFETGTTAEIVSDILHQEPKLPSELNPELSEEFDRAITTALSKRKADRQEAVPYLRDAVVESVSVSATASNQTDMARSQGSGDTAIPDSTETRSTGGEATEPTENSHGVASGSARANVRESATELADFARDPSYLVRSIRSRLKKRGNIRQFYRVLLSEPLRLGSGDDSTEFPPREPETGFETGVFTVWRAVATLLVVFLFPFALIRTVRFDEQRVRVSLRGTAFVSAITLAVLCWGALAVVSEIYFAFPADEVNVLILACIIAILATAGAISLSQIRNRFVAALLSYPFALTAVFLPPLVAVLLSDQLAQFTIVYSEEIAVFLQDEVLAEVGLKDYFVRNFDRNGGAYVIMWVVISVPLGWILGTMVTLADFIRPKSESSDED